MDVLVQAADMMIPGPHAPLKLERQLTTCKEDLWGRVCMTCANQLPQEQPSWARQCEECYKNPKTKRRCKVCKELKIPLTEPMWKQVCGSCYISSKLRACILCKQLKIKEIDPVWRTVCSDCYKNKDLFTECASCGEKSIKPGVPSYLKYCGPCYLVHKQKKKEAEKKSTPLEKQK